MQMQSGLARSVVRFAAFAIVVLIALFLRYPSQFLDPSIGTESLTFHVRQFAEDGFASLLYPVNGYLITVSRLFDVLALAISPYAAPLFASAFANAYTVLILFAVWRAPTRLRSPLLCALAPLFIPIQPEPFAVSLYSFWWSAVGLALTLFWVAGRSRTWDIAAIVLAVTGALSSPMGIVYGPLFMARWLRDRTQFNFALMVAVAAPSIIQLAIILATDGAATHPGRTFPVTGIIRETLGYFVPVLAPFSPRADLAYTVIGFLFGSALVAAAAAQTKRFDFFFWILVLLVAAAAAAYLMRIGTDVAHPLLSGGRYFMLPFIFLSWLVLYLIAEMPGWLRAGSIAAIAFSWVLATPYTMWRTHDPLPWASHIRLCKEHGDVQIVGQFFGNADAVWRTPVTQAGCRFMVGLNPLNRLIEPYVPELFAARTAPYEGGQLSSALVIAAHGWSPDGFYSMDVVASLPDDIRAFGSHVGGDAATGDLVLEFGHEPGEPTVFLMLVGPGEREALLELEYPDGSVRTMTPASRVPGWIKLEIFSHQTGVHRLTVRDIGSGWGEWAALAFASPERRGTN